MTYSAAVLFVFIVHFMVKLWTECKRRNRERRYLMSGSGKSRRFASA